MVVGRLACACVKFVMTNQRRRKNGLDQFFTLKNWEYYLRSRNFIKDEDNETKIETSSYTSRRTTAAEDESRMTIAERLRRKNQELISSSSSDRSSDRSITDRYSSLSLRGDRSSGSDNSSSTSSYGSSYARSQSSTSSFRDRDKENSTPSTDTTSSIRSRTYGSQASSDTGSSDAKAEIQKKLAAAQKDLADYKAKYDKIMKEKAQVQEQMDKAKTDVEKITELKNDNLRLKDENGALIRVISKLSRTPTTSAS